jgi:hypothetical protein
LVGILDHRRSFDSCRFPACALQLTKVFQVLGFEILTCRSVNAQ